jgi:hypothetical protein
LLRLYALLFLGWVSLAGLGLSGCGADEAAAPEVVEPAAEEPQPEALAPAPKQANQELSTCGRDRRCSFGYVCDYSFLCPRGKTCAEPVGDFYCQKKCITNTNCSGATPVCGKIKIWKGDYAKHYQVCTEN